MNFKLSLIPLWVKFLFVLALAGGIFYTGWQAGADHEARACVEADNKRLANEIEAHNQTKKANEDLREEVNKISGELEDALANQKVVTRYVTKQVPVEIEKPIYHECVVPPSGVRLRSEAAEQYNNTRTGSSGKSASEVSSASSGRSRGNPNDGRSL